MKPVNGTYRSGTSQLQRKLLALSPDHFRMEERDIAELIEYAKKQAALLSYFNEQNAHDGNWEAFLQGDAAEMAAFLENPAAFGHQPEKKARYSRPHLVLFLVFLKLLKRSHHRLNELTRKQLDFYFLKALGFAQQPAVAGRVHILAELNEDEPSLLIPKDALLQAGEDAEGNPIRYQTDQELLANQARIGRMMSLRLEREVTGIARLREERKFEEDNGLLAVLELVYRQPGTENTPRPYPAGPPHENRSRWLDKELISELDALKEEITETYGLRLATFQRILEEYQAWYGRAAWEEINDFLENVDEKVNPGQEPRAFDDIRDFHTNFEQVLGFSWDGNKKGDNTTNVFEGLPNVKNIYELATRLSDNPENTGLLNFFREYFKLDDGLEAFTAAIGKYREKLKYLHNIQQLLKSSKHYQTENEKDRDAAQYQENKVLTRAFSGLLGLGLQQKDDTHFIKLNDNNQPAGGLALQLTQLGSYFQMSAEDFFFVRELYREPEGKPPWQWQKADELLEKAYRAWLQEDLFREKEDSPVPLVGPHHKPEIIRWKNLYQWTDATQNLVEGPEGSGPFPRWKLFGKVPDEKTGPAGPAAARIGWGISSPCLALSEGARTLTLEFDFQADVFDAQRPAFRKYLKNWGAESAEKGPYPFECEISTAKGWLAITDWRSFEIREGEARMIISLRVGEQEDALAPLEEEGYASPWPSLRLLLPAAHLGFKDGKHIKAYELFKGQQLESVTLSVEVEGLEGLQVQTKDGAVNANKPFEPFGRKPETGDRLLITHRELAAQRLETLELGLEWKNLPKEGLEKYYAPYGELGKAISNDGKAGETLKVQRDTFKVKVSLARGQRPFLVADEQNLFSGSEEKKSLISLSNISGALEASGYTYAPKPHIRLAREVAESQRYFELELTPRDFLHDEYIELLNRRGLAVANLLAEEKVDQKKLKKLNVHLPPPFTPVLKRIVVSYSSSVIVDWTEREEGSEDQVFHIEPFGLRPLSGVVGAEENAVPFLPEFEAEGALYIGLEKLQPPQDVSFLFQLAEGSARPDLPPAPLRWSYLSQNEWAPLEQGQLVKDTTRGLQSSGLIQIHFPEKASREHQRMPAGLHWLRAQVERFPESLSDGIAVHTQALSASWKKAETGSHQPGQPLAPGSITQPARPLPGLAALQQPYSSFQGKPAEAPAQLYRRASERLRHKQRALTLWDYEHLILEAFPDVYKAKALPAGPGPGGYEPGVVRIIVLPDIRRRRPFDPFDPKVPLLRLQKIQEYLQDKAPAFASVRVQNPRVLSLQLRVAVRFYDMNNFGHYAGELHQKLLEYLSPWAFDSSADIHFGGKLQASLLVDLIKSQPYVDFIERPILKLKGGGQGMATFDEQGLIEVAEPDVVVASARRHIIEYLELPAPTARRIRQGIGFAKIEYDFQIAEDKS